MDKSLFYVSSLWLNWKIVVLVVTVSKGSLCHEFGVKSPLPSQEWPCGRHAGLGWSGSLEMSHPSEGMKQVSAAEDALLWAMGRLCGAGQAPSVLPLSCWFLL